MASTPDVLLIGGGIMSAHLGVMLKRLDPRLSITVYEAASDLARESSDGWNNAGTGHAGLCELNYTPPAPPGEPLDVSKAVEIFSRFEHSRQFWRHAVEQQLIARPETFIRQVPHLSFVRGPAHIRFLHARHAALVAHPFFRTMEYTADPAVIHRWAPLLVEGRRGEPIAATRVAAGTDVNFGQLSRQLLGWLGQQEGCRVLTGHRVTGLRRDAQGWWVTTRHVDSGETLRDITRFVFIGAGGGTLPLLQASGLPLARGLGAFPIAGQWLSCENPAVVRRHFGKVYGPPPADSGALGGPHLDLRRVDGRDVLLFGPFATWTSKFLHRAGRVTDLPYSLRGDNVGTLLRTGLRNRVLVRFLVEQAMQRSDARLRALREFYPAADDGDWRLVDAGIRVQAMKPSDAGQLNFGTEVIKASDGTLAALLGASPGASVSAAIALQVVQACFPEHLRSTAGYARMRAMIPTFDLDLRDPDSTACFARQAAQADEVLGLTQHRER